MAEENDPLFADEMTAEELIIEQPVEEQPAEQPVDPAPEAIVEPEPAPEPQPQRPDPGFVPIAAMMDERDRRKALEAELARYRQQQEAQPALDPLDDPAGFAAHQQQLVQQAIINDRFERSNEDAIEKYGEETVKAAVDWAAERGRTNPGFAAEYMSKPRPIHWIVQQHKREETLGQIGDRSIDDFVREYIAKNPTLITPAPAAATPIPVVASPQQAPQPVKVPRSLATVGSGPSDVRDVATGPLAAVDAVFPQ